MRVVAAILILAAFTGCASKAARLNAFGQLYPGMTRDEAIEIMGQPDLVNRIAADREEMAWEMSFSTGCGVELDGNNVIVNKRCVSSNGPTPSFSYRPSYQPIQPYSVPVPNKTNCITNTVNGTAYTSCR